ncbi:aminodeoxychorismate lyase [Novosphingobium fuchskuhlense]|uniref:Endolytic murein transglycosylase n=1 Tax=Novosphingobium fuchskuhlense TaxID=1117702 RepID=A0A124JUW3_9SPHN|nr:endolytic transglycosylase MltG [Novosphingobium fuchskuhlense]KUR71657.1 aminodeoxychorismate lyase [Novosphingobium fuchskuhlense]
MHKSGRLRIFVFAAALVVAVFGVHFLYGWYGSGPLVKEATLSVPDGATLASVAEKLEAQGIVASASTFRLRARLLGGNEPLKAGEYYIPAHASGSSVLAILQGEGGEVRRMVTIPEGMPAIMVQERLAAVSLLTGPVPTLAEGSVLPDTYAFQRGESRTALVTRMQQAMARTLDKLWADRAPDTVARSKEEAVILASIVEKETGKPSERPMVAGLYSNRLRQGMMLQADPTIIYPITHGKPLGRRIRQSEIQAVNSYNTYTMVGLPAAPITNPGKDSIAAVLHPARTNALYMVADGKGGHVFAATLQEHNANVARWFALRRARGEL